MNCKLYWKYLNVKNRYVCGDFNIDLLKYDCHQNSKDFVNQLFGYGYYALINSLTRITGTNTTQPDNIFTIYLTFYLYLRYVRHIVVVVNPDF